MKFLGSFCLGLVIGWVTYRTLRRKAEGVALGDIASVLGAIGGATIVAIFRNAAFDSYCVGLAVGFFGYFTTGFLTSPKTPSNKQSVDSWMNE